jgi:hypothetical protein
MLSAKTNFAHFTSNYEIFIAGGTSKHEFALKNVESYDIKQNVWIK